MKDEDAKKVVQGDGEIKEEDMDGVAGGITNAEIELHRLLKKLEEEQKRKKQW